MQCNTFSRYTMKLRPEKCTILPESKLSEMFRRMFTRLSSIRAEESMITITAEMAAHVHAKHVGKDISRKLSGDRTKMLILSFPFICRDLAYNEVSE